MSNLFHEIALEEQTENKFKLGAQITKENFLTLLKIVNENLETLPLDELGLDGLLDFIKQSDFFGIPSGRTMADKAVVEVIKRVDPDDHASAQNLHEHLQGKPFLTAAKQQLDGYFTSYLIRNPEKADLISGDIRESIQTADLRKFTEINDDQLKKLTQFCPNLNHLFISSPRIRDSTFKTVAALTHLETLDLSSCWNLTDASIASLAALKQLQTLNLSECVKLKGASIASLAALTQLQTLDLRSCVNLTDASIASLAALTHLQTLDLSSCENLTGATIASLAALTQLKTLNLSCCWNLTDASTASLAALKHLQTLNLSNCWKLTDASIASLAALMHLKTLNLSNCYKLTDASIASLRKLLPQLKIER